MSGPSERANSKAGSNLENAGSNERDEIAADREALVRIMLPASGDECSLSELRAYAVRILAADWLAERDRRTAATAVIQFAHWVAIARAHNGSDHERGQSLYNESLNAVLPTWALEWADEQQRRNQ